MTKSIEWPTLRRRNHSHPELWIGLGASLAAVVALLWVAPEARRYARMRQM
ncbi:DUF6893 family small protein [Vulgatibacter incomptus]|uniref:Uncharacterized protein n=1 Tax=Vulgatibacter incomptus TaxID=1391653 RepID=A0A0K1P9D8_9BACT|nr:hypothetical protein [Vulgatibacter incomptus]AKU90153.1 hypothetical protein AKJ08_0540 [Vulgatibacter incomptus]